MADVSKMRYGLIGAGAIAKTYVQAFAVSDEAKLVAVADVREEAAAELAEAAGATAFTDYREMLAKADVEALVICTPPATHPEIAIDLLEQGYPVLCEKPLAIDSESAEAMIAAAERSGAQLTMASKFRYVDDVRRAKELVESGILGEILQFENVFASRVEMSSRWNADPEVAGGGVLIDNGTHSVDIMRYFLGPLAELQVVEGKRLQVLQVEDTVRVFVRTADGVMGNIDLSWSMNKEQPAYISIYGSEGTLLVGWKESKYRLSGDADWTVFGKGYDKVQAFSSQIANVTRAIRGEEPLLINSRDALASVQVIEAAYRALDKALWEPVGKAAEGELDLVSV